VAVENDYNALVFRVNDLAEELLRLKLEVEQRLLEEKRDGLEPNATNWVNIIRVRTLALAGIVQSLSKMAEMVLHSRPGEAVFEDQPPPAPDAPPP
jgi:hypothetical protein